MSKRGQRRSLQSNPLKKLQEGIFKKILPEHYVHSKLIEFEKLDDDARLLWRDFQSYLASEREKILPQITEALDAVSDLDFCFDNFSRIIGSQYSTQPLNAKGSYLLPPGGRFNIGQSISYSAYFPALYIANNYKTAFAEKFSLKESGESQNGLDALDFALTKPGSFTHMRVKGVIKKVIDLRENKVIESFYDSVSSISMPRIYTQRAKTLGISMAVVNSSDWLRDAIYDSKYQQWDYWLDQPSPSQWFAHYVRLSGIQGIIYKSVKEENGINLALFPENFEGTESFVELMDETDFVRKELARLDGSNFNKFI